MPYKSKAQVRFFHSAGAKKAGISAATVRKFDKATAKKKGGFKSLPARSKKK